MSFCFRSVCGLQREGSILVQSLIFFPFHFILIPTAGRCRPDSIAPEIPKASLQEPPHSQEIETPSHRAWPESIFVASCQPRSMRNGNFPDAESRVDQHGWNEAMHSIERSEVGQALPLQYLGRAPRILDPVMENALASLIGKS